MDVPSKSWFSDESDDDNFLDIQSELMNSVNHRWLPADGEAGGTSSQQRIQKLVERENSDEVTQKLIDLSALVPGPTEIDEITVISKTIDYMKELQASVNMLEDQMRKDQAVPANKKAKVAVFTEDEAASEGSASRHRPAVKISGYNREIDTSDDCPPDIEARFLNKDVLVRIHCRKSKGLLINILQHLENLHLSAMHNNVVHFGSSQLVISIVAQMEEGFTMTVKELIANLRTSFSQYI